MEKESNCTSQGWEMIKLIIAVLAVTSIGLTLWDEIQSITSV